MKIDLKLPGGGEFHFEREKKPKERDGFDLVIAFYIIVFIGMMALFFWVMR